MFFHLFKIIITSLIFIAVSHYVFILLRNNLTTPQTTILQPEKEHITIEPIQEVAPPNVAPNVAPNVVPNVEPNVAPNVAPPNVVPPDTANMNNALNDYIKELKINE